MAGALCLSEKEMWVLEINRKNCRYKRLKICDNNCGSCYEPVVDPSTDGSQK